VRSGHFPKDNLPRIPSRQLLVENWLPWGDEVIACDVNGRRQGSGNRLLNLPDGTLSGSICSFCDLHVEQQRGGDNWPKLEVALTELVVAAGGSAMHLLFLLILNVEG
jgi:hypothetical protein